MEYLYKLFQNVVLVMNIVIFVCLLLLNKEAFVCTYENKFPLDFLIPDLGKQQSSNSNISYPPNKSENLMDIPYLQYCLNNHTVCPAKHYSANILLIIVHSARRNFICRNAIRKTWGSVSLYRNWQIRTIFLLGEGNSEEDIDLALESEQYGDLIEGNFVDSYRNMTYKHLMGYKWTLKFCPQADFIFKVDDDVFVDIFTIIDILKEDKDMDLICPILPRRKVERDVENKWHVTNKEYSFFQYPPYCLGAGYIISIKWVKTIYDFSNKLKYFWIDDIFVTGILREYAQIEAKEKMRLLSLKLFKEVLLDVDPDAVEKNYKLENDITSNTTFSVIYFTVLRKDKFGTCMEYLWKYLLKLRTVNLKPHFLSNK